MCGMYKYTLPNSILSDEQRTFYEENGFLVIQNLIEQQILKEFKQRFNDIVEGRVPTHGLTIRKERLKLKRKSNDNISFITTIEDFVWDEVLAKYCMDETVLKFVEAIIGPNITTIKTIFRNEPPASSSVVIKHLYQELHNFPFRPENRIVGSWTAMEYIHKENGCLYLIPGSHKGTLLPHNYLENGGRSTQVLEENQNVKTINVEMEKGDTIFFHPLLLHGFNPNLSKNFRKSISCHYAESNCYFFALEEINAADQISKNTSKIVCSQELAWKLKSRCVKGYLGNLSHDFFTSHM